METRSQDRGKDLLFGFHSTCSRGFWGSASENEMLKCVQTVCHFYVMHFKKCVNACNLGLLYRW